MINQASTILTDNVDSSKKDHNIPLDHLDYKYISTCENVKELEKIYRVLISGAEGKYPDLENFTSEKIARLNPTSRALRKDLPISSTLAMPKTERNLLDEDMDSFFNKMENFEKEIVETDSTEPDQLPPVRNKSTTVQLDSKNTVEQDAPISNLASKSKKSAKPRDYSEWSKIEKMLDNEDGEEESSSKKSTDAKKKVEAKVVNNKSQINLGSSAKQSIKNLPKISVHEDLSDNLKEIKADQEKCKGNESFKSGCYEEALHYYTKSINFMPTAASFNNRAMTYLKLEKWDSAIEDCNYVLKFEPSNVKALLRRSTALFKKKKYTDAEKDIQKCLTIEANNKKALELKIQIEEQIVKEKEKLERVKKQGGKRLQIEESESSEDEDIEDKLANIVLNGKEKPTSVEVKDSITGKKTSIKISEVDSEDCDETDDEEECQDEKQPIAQSTETMKPEQKTEDVNFTEKIAPVESVTIELPKSIIDFKDKANTQFANGQYSDAFEFYSFAIDALKSEKTNNQDLHKYYKNTLSILYNNRASCAQKICDYKSSINDCNAALDIITGLSEIWGPNEFKGLTVKLMSKKANAFEILEKYADAFSEYEKIMKLDNSVQNIQMNYNRIRNILKENGQFDKVRVKKADKPSAKSQAQETTQPKVEDISELYNEYKTKGNEYVKKAEYQYALGFYTKCIDLDSTNVIGYLNRSLCHVKLNQPDQAITDCTFVLEQDKNNVKALYRRASANKLKQKYDLVAKDLKKLLNLEPNNQIAASEYKSVTALLEKIPKKTLIKEVTPEKQPRKPIIEEIKVQENKKVISEPIKKDVVKEEINTVKPEKVTKPLVFTKITNGYEFLQGWNSINPKDKDSYARLLIHVDAEDLSYFIGTKLDDDMLNQLIESIHKLHCQNEPGFQALVYLKSLSKTKRFDVTKLFIDKEHSNLVKEVTESKKYKSIDAECVRKAFGI